MAKQGANKFKYPKRQQNTSVFYFLCKKRVELVLYVFFQFHNSRVETRFRAVCVKVRKKSSFTLL